MKTWHFAAILFVVLSAEALVLVPEFWGPGRSFMAAILPSLVVDYANNDRLKIKEPGLKTSLLLTKAAELKASDMARRGYFSHTGPLGESPWTWLDKVGYSYVYAGENLAVNFFDSADVHRAWMNSPDHRDNLLDKKFNEVGVGIAQGKFEGRDSLYVVQFFGSTEETLTLTRSKVSGIGEYRLLSAVNVLASNFLDFNKILFLPLLEFFGYQKLNGKII